MSNSIKCLMIGQAGIGKTTFLEQIPNCLKETDMEEFVKNGFSRETYSFETLNDKFEKVKVIIENCDITLETCLNDADLIVNNKIIPSNQFINIRRFDFIIFCFAMDDPGSFELIKSKWEIDLKKNKQKQNSFVLIGLKSETVIKSNQEKECKDGTINTLKARNSFKKRSYSVNSASSTSKFAKNNKSDILTCEQDSHHKLIPLSVYKKFSKQIGSMNFIQHSIFIENFESSKSKNILNSFELLIKNILSKNYDKIPRQFKAETEKKSIPKSLSAPIKNLVNRKSTKEKKDLRHLNLVHFENNSFINLNGEENQTLPVVKQQNKTNEPLSIKSKLSRLVIGLGTYVVTCGSAQSRRLTDLKNFRNLDQNNKKLIKKNKSWLLLASEMSLNNLDYD